MVIGAIVSWLVEDGIRHESGGWQPSCSTDGTGTGDVTELRALGTAQGGDTRRGTFAVERAERDRRADGPVGGRAASTKELLVFASWMGGLAETG